MTDPFQALHTPAPPVDPDPAFARTLRARVERALLDLPEVPVTSTLASRPIDLVRLHALTPYLAVVDSRAAVEFYVAAFGARHRGEPILMPDGKVGHVEVALGDSVLMLADEFPDMGLVAPVNRGGVSQSLRLEVADPDAVVAAAVAAGARLERAVTDSPHGRGGVVADPSGHRWMISREAPAVRTGDVVYTSLLTPDVERTGRFFGDVLGWVTAGDHDGDGRRITNLTRRLGLFGGPRPTAFLCFSVPDVDAAVAVVRAAGGTAQEPVAEHGGRTADCVDDQGLAFALFEGDATPDAPEPGAPVYLEFRVPDAGRARAFYGTVLGWGFRPGGDPGYWHPVVDGDAAPSTGLTGGYADAAVVPAFGVTDLDAAADAVRAAGGTASATAYGKGLTCTDDQGAPFALVAL